MKLDQDGLVHEGSELLSSLLSNNHRFLDEQRASIVRSLTTLLEPKRMAGFLFTLKGVLSGCANFWREQREKDQIAPVIEEDFRTRIDRLFQLLPGKIELVDRDISNAGVPKKVKRMIENLKKRLLRTSQAEKPSEGDPLLDVDEEDPSRAGRRPESLAALDCLAEIRGIRGEARGRRKGRGVSPPADFSCGGKKPDVRRGGNRGRPGYLKKISEGGEREERRINLLGRTFRRDRHH